MHLLHVPLFHKESLPVQGFLTLTTHHNIINGYERSRSEYVRHCGYPSLVQNEEASPQARPLFRDLTLKCAQRILFVVKVVSLSCVVHIVDSNLPNEVSRNDLVTFCLPRLHPETPHVTAEVLRGTHRS